MALFGDKVVADNENQNREAIGSLTEVKCGDDA